MKKKSEIEDELRPEYDFSKLTVVAKGLGRKVLKGTPVILDPDVAEMFPTTKHYDFWQERQKSQKENFVNSLEAMMSGNCGKVILEWGE